VSAKNQVKLRDAINELVLGAMDEGAVTPIEGFAACIGAASVSLSVLPPEMRQEIVRRSEGSLLALANKQSLHSALASGKKH
jgi:hypothetical protein